LKGFLLEAGFSSRQISASYECLEPVSIITDLLADMLERKADASREQITALRDWSGDPPRFSRSPGAKR